MSDAPDLRPKVEKACEGGRTLTDHRAGADFEECCYCGRSVRWDLTEHRLFGFQNCGSKTIPGGQR